MGVVQVALIRELSAYHALSSVDLSIRLVIAVVIAAHGLGAALAPVIPRIGERRALAILGAGMAIYLVALLLAGLWWLEPELSARAVDAPRLLLLGALISPPFVACGMIVTHVTAAVQRVSPGRIGAFVGLSLVGTLVGKARVPRRIRSNACTNCWRSGRGKSSESSPRARLIPNLDDNDP